MYNVTRVVHAANGAGADEWAAAVKNIAAVAESSNALRRLVCTTLPGVINGGDLIVHLQFEDEMAWQTARDAVDDSLRCATVDHFHGAEYSSGTTGRSGAEAAGQVYRALFIRVSPGTPQDVLEEFERDLLRMPTHISSICAWRLSRVDAATGHTPWTHVWEQEFTDLGSLQTQYLDHPIHWAVVDRWFDPECPEAVVHDRICHTFGNLTERLLTVK
ncbi:MULTISPECIES: Dabb family protein [unclassified Rhodococcus (in: high G+C Gram-positive bacteria)]|uniref:Dabb family protein n=1 Tax=unclassified Rhodococcus (in: high G+C Gram-positive bacteria) TaxID=192944 RepID=UPI001AE4E56B|nr:MULTISPECIES: Dabb family protein [unclassified Rhodococcus (in: high G+C Gram-positive bacteria)]MBP2525608.1 hypothetical protein [Rhodococcus sp. PvP104]MDA3632993.1 Dabb family protein [Rhodococcus sp. C-2]